MQNLSEDDAEVVEVEAHASKRRGKRMQRIAAVKKSPYIDFTRKRNSKQEDIQKKKRKVDDEIDVPGILLPSLNTSKDVVDLIERDPEFTRWISGKAKKDEA